MIKERRLIQFTFAVIAFVSLFLPEHGSAQTPKVVFSPAADFEMAGSLPQEIVAADFDGWQV